MAIVAKSMEGLERGRVLEMSVTSMLKMSVISMLKMSVLSSAHPCHVDIMSKCIVGI
jgi:hypothetical protein